MLKSCMKRYWVLLPMLILLTALLSACASNTDYDAALTYMEKGEFEQARDMLALVDPEYADTALYTGFIDGTLAFEAENWLSAATFFEEIESRVEELQIAAYNNKISLAKAEEYRRALLIPLLQRFGISYKDYELISENTYGKSLIANRIDNAQTVLSGKYSENATEHDIAWDNVRCMYSLRTILYQNSLYRYYEQQIENGNDIYSLADRPYLHCEVWKPFADHRADTLKIAVANAGMTEVFTRTAATVLPFDVVGDKLCIMDRIDDNGYPGLGDQWSDAFRSIVSPFRISQEPADVRYVLWFTINARDAWGAWYNMNTGAKVAGIYTQVVEVTLFDLKTGETLFQKTYEATPKNPAITGFSGESIGEFSPLAPLNYMKEDLVPVLDGLIHAHN